jgi:hypothetical protein
MQKLTINKPSLLTFRHARFRHRGSSRESAVTQLLSSGGGTCFSYVRAHGNN